MAHLPDVNPRRDLALEFILRTGRNIFLTGRAGTGKTTLLRKIVQKTKKQHIIVAPTGVAAINAGGMTIHSVFQLPPSNFIPGNRPVDPDHFVTQAHLSKHQRMVKDRIDLLRNLELLIIDEISMVRADLLDAIDFTLRRIRRSQEVFGGVQVVVIGDLYQLAPVVKQNAWSVLQDFYASPYFFASLAWQKSNAFVIELDHVYRQTDADFVALLNRIREGVREDKDIHRLNEQLTGNPPRDEDIITLTTHNRKANTINSEELNKLEGETLELNAVVKGTFNKSAYPVPAKLTVKPGAQVMFVRNSMEGQWYNGKLATVVDLSGDTLYVEDAEERRIEVDREEWKNIKYKVDKGSKEIIKDELGTYLQYPIQLAWAVTIHKSQGLTFNDVILDLENTFAAGQLYVALSRCRSLEGISMTSRVEKYHIKIDELVKQYYEHQQLPDNIDQILLEDIKAQEDRLLSAAFDFSRIIAYTEDWHHYVLTEDVSSPKGKATKAQKIIEALEDLQTTAVKFQQQIHHLVSKGEDLGEEAASVIDRSEKAIIYFTNEIFGRAIVPLTGHLAKVKKEDKDRKYLKLLDYLLGEYWHAMTQLYDLQYSGQKILQRPPKHVRQKNFDMKRAIADAGSSRKGETYEVTLNLHEQGKTIEEIAQERAMSTSTIESHIGRWISRGKIDIRKVLTQDKLDAAVTAFMESPDAELSAIRPKLPILLTWGELRWVKAYVKNIQDKI